MESVLKKTVASLEKALHYNPENIELMASLTEGYVRMGRLDDQTLALCEKVLSKYGDNHLLQKATEASLMVEQTAQLDDALARGQPPPAPGVLDFAITMLDEFLRDVPECDAGWFAWTRLCLLAGRFKDALTGVARLRESKFSELSDLQRILDWVGRKYTPEQPISWMPVYEAFRAIDEEKQGIRALERVFDRGCSKEEVGGFLLRHYLESYDAAHPDDVPEAIRPRFFQLLLDHGDPTLTGEWLRKASLYGWQVTARSIAYIRSLIDDEQLELAFDLLQRMTLDSEIKDLLNSIALQYEKGDEIDEAVSILQYINKHEINESEIHKSQEIELTRSMELSLAELQVKNGRLSEALGKYVSALCLHQEPDAVILARIDELVAQGVAGDPQSLMKLACYFHSLKDGERTIFYIERAMAAAENNPAQLEELDKLFDQLMATNPDSPELRLHRGRLSRRRGRLDEAITDFKIAASESELTDRANRQLAQVYREAGQYREALIRYQSANVTPDDLEHLYQLHQDFMRIEDARSALQTLEMIRGIKPDYRDVNEFIRQIEERSPRASAPLPPLIPETDEKMKELIGDLAVGRYEYLDKVGSGGMGVVYKVMDVRHNRAVAMKILRDGLAGSSKALDRFFREARIAAQIRHRNIVDIFDYNISSQDGQNYIVMEYIEGQSLREFIDLHFDDTISTSIDYIAEMLFYCVQLFDALHATHKQGIIHRDIKPDNIMITPLGEVKITDFGIVHVEEATFTPTGAMLGTPRYMAPEQVTGQKVDGRSDIYSVGILLYEVLTGSPPFMTGDISYQQVNKTPVEPRLINSVIPQSVNNFILKCLEKKPDARYANAIEAKNALAEILQSLGGCKKYENMTSAGSTSAGLPPLAKDSRAPKPPPKAGITSNLEKLDLDDLDLDLD